MRISMLNLKKCLGVKELEFKPGQITLIEGEEGQGKTSILESIQRFFWNKSERSGTFVYSDEDGTAEKAEIYIDLDDGTSMKKYINKENKVTTTGIEKDGMSPKNPETFLKSLVNERQLNPISLIHMEDKELTDLILSLIPIKITEADVTEWLLESPPFIDYEKHGLQVCKDVEKLYFEKRTEVNRRVKDLEGEIKSDLAKLPEGYDAETWRSVSLAEKYEVIKEANESNKQIEQHQAKVDGLALVIEGLRNQAKAKIADIKQKSADDKKTTEDEITKLKQQINILEGKLSQADAVCAEKVKTTTEHYKSLAETAEKDAEKSKEHLKTNKPTDIEPLEVAHKEAEVMKSYIRTADDLKVKQNELVTKKSEAEKLTDKIEYMRTKPQMLLANATMPVEGITVDNQGNVLINNRPIINLSGGERIKFVMSIVRATAGALKIILIDGFERLSPKGQKQFIDECSGDGFQYIITKVTEGNLKITAIGETGKAVNAETGELIN